MDSPNIWPTQDQAEIYARHRLVHRQKQKSVCAVDHRELLRRNMNEVFEQAIIM